LLRRTEVLALAFALTCSACGSGSESPRLLLGATHTLEDSGLLEALQEAWEGDHGAESRLSVVVAGSGEVLTMARRGDVDVVLSHSPAAEEALMADGIGLTRQPVMHNEFVLLGPPGDPADVRSATTPADAFRRIADAAQPFISRGDDSGTHRAELAIWSSAGLSPEWDGYIESGAGMADGLRVASARHAYILSDRATYSQLAGTLDLEILYENDEMRNQYSVILIANAANPAGARLFADWIRSPATQQLIEGFGRDATDRPLFVPDALRD